MPVGPSSWPSTGCPPHAGCPTSTPTATTTAGTTSERWRRSMRVSPKTYAMRVRLPGVDRPGTIGFEFALVLNDTNDAQLLVAPWYNPYLGPRKGVGPTGLDAFYNEAATANSVGHDGAFDSLFVTTNRWRIGRNG